MRRPKTNQSGMNCFRHLIIGSDRPATQPRGKNIPRPAQKICPPVPAKFHFGIGPANPLLSTRAATVYLGCTVTELLKLIDEGRLHWAFDISGTESQRREIRIARESIFEFTGLISPPADENENEEQKLNSLLDRLIPLRKHAGGDSLSVRQLARCLDCTYNHIRNLITEDSLRLSQQNRSLDDALLVTRQSVLDFLRDRRIS